MIMESLNVNVAVSPDREEVCEITWTQGPPVGISARIGEQIATNYSGPDLFEALCAFRQYLEKNGYHLLCNAARINAYPSNMTRHMGSGRKVYLLRMGHQARREDLVDIFAPIERELYGTISEQRDMYTKWLRSLG